MKTITATPSTIRRKWYLIDGKGQTLGRVASEVAKRLAGKHKPEYTPNLDTGDYIVLINAAEMHLTGKKKKDKIYHRNSGYTSGLRSLSYEKLLAVSPIKPFEIAVKGMLPKGPLGRKMFKKLNVYGGSAHPHTAQQPELLSLAE